MSHQRWQPCAICQAPTQHALAGNRMLSRWDVQRLPKAPPPRTLCGRLATPSLAAMLLATPTLAALPEMHRKSSMTRRIRDPQKRRCLHDLCRHQGRSLDN
jgi:hypothetical protein